MIDFNNRPPKEALTTSLKDSYQNIIYKHVISK